MTGLNGICLRRAERGHPADAELKDRPLPRGQGPWLDYPTALAADWLISTGVIEGACRTR